MKMIHFGVVTSCEAVRYHPSVDYNSTWRRFILSFTGCFYKNSILTQTTFLFSKYLVLKVEKAVWFIPVLCKCIQSFRRLPWPRRLVLQSWASLGSSSSSSTSPLTISLCKYAMKSFHLKLICPTLLATTITHFRGLFMSECVEWCVWWDKSIFFYSGG